ncbi:MAG: BTAD domain-containing putative transcriptional regulator [Acidobacteria bacterium]|nr:BTAD domain-containing putative transcriptional regulator [Acidobacteriota bacterium]
MGTLQITLLGAFSVAVNGEVVPEDRWTRRKAKTLVKVLALEPNRELHRDQLVERLWPELEPSLGQNNLHKTIHAARRALEPQLEAGTASQFLVTIEQRLALRAPASFQIDAVDFEQAATAALASGGAGELAAAVQLYRGELLPEDRYEDWAAGPRERLAQRFGELLDQLGHLHEAAQEHAAALEVWHKAVQADPCNETAHRGLMRAYAASGRRHLAINQYRTCVEDLRRQLEAEPEAATTSLYELIVSGNLPVQAAAVAASPPTSLAASLAAEPARAEVSSSLPPPAGTAVAKAGLSSRLRLRWAVGATVGLAMLGGWEAWRQWQTSRQINSLAVLPFTSDAPLEFLADGITEGLINSLSRLPNLRVMARSTVFLYKGRATDPREAARATGVRALVTGRVVQQGSALVVSAELVSADDGAQLWGRQYRLEASQLTSAQSALASDLAAALALELHPEAKRRLAEPDTRNSAAYRNYLLGRFFWNQRTPDGFRKAIEQFDEAVRLDPSYAAAYAGLADCYGLLAFDAASPIENMTQARAMANRALQLDPALAEAHTSLAMIKALYDWDWAGAEAEFRRAIELNPGSATAHHWFGVHLNGQGRRREAEAELKLALELDPLSRIITVNAGYPAYHHHEYPAAERFYRRALDLDAAFVVAHEDLALLYEQTGRTAEAAREIATSLRLTGHDSWAAHLEAEVSYPAKLRRLREQLIAESKDRYVAPILIADLSARLGDSDAAFVWLDRALEQRAAPLVYLKTDPRYDQIRNDPRFAVLLKKIGLN